MVKMRYGPVFTLCGKELKSAAETYAGELSRQCEAYFFRKAREQRPYWEPTRQLVERLWRCLELDEAEMKKLYRRIRLLQAVAAMQGMAILFLAFTILLLR